MRAIEKLAEKIENEMDDARCYAEDALRAKDSDPELSRVYLTIANEEINHLNALHSQIVRQIDLYKKSKGDPPADMLAVYNYLHDRQVDHVSRTKAIMAEAK